MQQTAANQEYLFRNPEALQAVRQLQGREFIARQADVAAASAYAFTAEQGVDAEKMSGLLDALGEDAISAFMGSNGDVATDRERRNQAMADAMRQRIKDRLGASAEAFGSDEKFFGGDREIKILDDFYKGRPERIELAEIKRRLRSAT